MPRVPRLVPRRRARCGSTHRADRRPTRRCRPCRATRRISPRPATTIRRCRSRSSGRICASAGGPPPVLSIGAWRGQATVSPERLRFSVPRAAFVTDARRTSFAAAALLHPARLAHGAVPAAVHRAARPAGFVRFRPAGARDDAGIRTPWCAPEILSRAPAGRDPHGPPLFRSAGRLALRQGASARGHRRAPGLAGGRQRSDAECGLGRVRPCRGARAGLRRRDRPPGHAQRANGHDRPFRGDPGA